MRRKNLVLMDTGMFFEGMYISAGIYYLYKNSYVLFCRNVILTPRLIKRLRKAAKATNGVFVEERDCKSIWSESLRQYFRDTTTYEQKYQKARLEYDNVVSRTEDFLKDVSVDDTLSLNMAEEVTDSIVDEINRLDEFVMLRCVNMIHQADRYLYTHSVNVATLNGMVGKWMGLADIEVKRLIKIGLLHDLGKLRIPTEILYKPGSLIKEEFEVIKRHSLYSYEMLLQSGEKDEVILRGVRHHHEKPNGGGYPDGLLLQNISLEARITSVCDVYDAMVSKRCYKDPSTPFEVLAQFKDNRFSDLDLRVVNLFLENISFLFIGMNVKLSNGCEGEVMFVRPTDYANPVVKVGKRVFATDETCRCISANGEYFANH